MESMQEFLEKVAEVLEVPAVQPGDAFRDVPMWGSLTGFALVVMIEQKYGKRLTAADFAGKWSSISGTTARAWAT